MRFLTKPGEFEHEINRGILSHRSKRLDELVVAIRQYIKVNSKANLITVEEKLDAWKARDPKEFGDRGKRLETELRNEIAHFGVHRIRVVDPNSHPVFEPWVWNDNGRIQKSTNCYAYACNDPYNHPLCVDPAGVLRDRPPQPGQLAGRPLAQARDLQAGPERYAVMTDDLCRAKLGQERRLIPLVRLLNEAVPDHVVNVPGYYLIALFTAPGVDYHWVRQDRDGTWSHKPGLEKATPFDWNGELINDPRDARFRVPAQNSLGQLFWADYEFSTFYYAPKGGVRTGDLGALRANVQWVARQA
jgi:hypothetical protein